MKTQEELQELKQEYEALTAKLKELTEDELNMVTGGFIGTAYLCDIAGCKLNPDTCSAKKVAGFCPKERF